jgi:glucose-6-phosphate 1-dehydrogenase
MESTKKRKIDDKETKSVPFYLQTVKELRNHKFKTEEVHYRVKFNQEHFGDKLIDLETELHGMFSAVMDNVDGRYSDNDKVSLSVSHSQLGRDVFIHLQPKFNLTADTLMER